MQRIALIVGLTLLTLAPTAAAGIDEAILNSNAEDPCPPIHVMPWPPYVVLDPNCLTVPPGIITVPPAP